MSNDNTLGLAKKAQNEASLEDLEISSGGDALEETSFSFSTKRQKSKTKTKTSRLGTPSLDSLEEKRSAEKKRKAKDKSFMTQTLEDTVLTAPSIVERFMSWVEKQIKKLVDFLVRALSNEPTPPELIVEEEEEEEEEDKFLRVK